MKRREFLGLLGGVAAACPLTALAQKPAVRRIGVLMALADDNETKARIANFREAIERLGWSEKRDIRIDIRFAAGRRDQHRPLAKELVAFEPDLILAQSSPIVATLQRETRVIPIVFVNVSDPIGEGFVASLARPGSNLTGVLLYEPGIMGKWLAMLKEIAPRLARVALLANPQTTAFGYFQRAAEVAAPSLAIELVPTPIENTAADIERALEAFATAAPNGGLLVLPDPSLVNHRDLVLTIAARHRLPAIYPFRLYSTAGGLMSYGIDQNVMFRLAASYVDRILRGAKPAELPVQAPTKYETMLNLKVAKALGLDVPSSLLVRADEVIE